MLEVEGVHTYYGESHILHGVSLGVGRGEAVALLGRNGVGKTTLIRSIAGLTPPRSGRVVFDGVELRGRRPYAIAQLGIGLVPQGRRTFPSLTVRENLLLPTSRLAGRPARRRGDGNRWTLDAVLREFPLLAERISERARHLSGGEQQLLAIGRALMANPDVILMDEPSEGLAPVLVQQLAGIMRSLRARGHSILLVEQNVDLALAVADHVYVIATGRIVHEAPAAALREAPAALAQHLGL